MGFLNRMWNWVRGKGYKETEELQVQDDEAIQKQTEKIQEEREAQQTIQQTTEEPTKETIKEELTTQTQLPRTPKEEKEAEQEYEKAIQQVAKTYDNAGSITKVQEQLGKTTINEITFTPTNELNTLSTIYKKLLQQSTISTIDSDGNEDIELINILIENRNRLQHRFSAEIVITTDKGVGTIQINGILAEQLNEIYDFIQVGATYSSQELKVSMQKALDYFEKQYGSIGGSIMPPMETRSTVTNIEIKLTFA